MRTDGQPRLLRMDNLYFTSRIDKLIFWTDFICHQHLRRRVLDRLLRGVGCLDFRRPLGDCDLEPVGNSGNDLRRYRAPKNQISAGLHSPQRSVRHDLCRPRRSDQMAAAVSGVCWRARSRQGRGSHVRCVPIDPRPVDQLPLWRSPCSDLSAHHAGSDAFPTSVQTPAVPDKLLEKSAAPQSSPAPSAAPPIPSPAQRKVPPTASPKPGSADNDGR